MSIQGRQSGSFGDEMTNILIGALIGTFGLTLVLRAAGSVAAFLQWRPLAWCIGSAVVVSLTR